MKRHLLPLVALLAVALIVTACGGEQGSPSATAPAATDAPASPSPDATPDATDGGAPTGELPGESQFAIPSFDLDGDPELAGRFPDAVNGQELQVISMRGDAFLGAAGDGDPAFEEFLERVGAEHSDVSVAFGGTLDQEVAVAAFRIAGADSGQLEDEFLSANRESGDISELTERSVGGKDVWSAESTDESLPGMVYIYVQGDTVYFLTTPDDAVAGEILEVLP